MAKTLERTQRNARHEAALMELARMGESSWNAALQKITPIDAAALEVHRVSVWLFDRDTSEIRCEDLYDRRQDRHESGAKLRARDYPRYFEALREQRVIAADDASADPRTSEFAETYLKPLGIVSMLDVPVWHGGRVAGVLCHEHTGAPRQWSAEEQDFAASVADAIALALEAAERQRAETRFRAIFEQFPLGIQILAPDGHTLQINRAYETLFGTNMEGLGDYNLRQDWQLRDKGLLHLVERGFQGENTIIPPIFYQPTRAPARWMQGFFFPVKDEAGAIREVILVQQDVSERKEADEALRASTEALRRAHDELEIRVAERTAELEAIFQALPDLYFRLDAEGTILDYKAGDASRLYVPPSEFLGRRMQDVLPPDVSREIAEAVAQVSRTGETACIEYSLPMPEGEIDFEARLVRLQGDQIITIVRDITERKRAERALQQSEEYFRTLIENASDIITILNADGTLRYHSPSARRLHGYADDELIGKSALPIIHPDDAERVRTALQGVRDNPGTGVTVEYRLRHRDGHWKVLESIGRTISPTTADEGVLINSRDITERRAAEEALQRSEEHFRLLTENTSDIIEILGPDGSIRYLNPSSERVLGYPVAELIGKNSFDLVHPDDLAGTHEDLSRILDDPSAARGTEFRARHRDGSWRVLEGRGRILPLDSPYPGSVVVNLRDITERKTAEEALQQSEEHFRLLIENASDIITIIEGDGTIYYQSPAAERVFGWEIDEMVGRSAFDFFHPDDIPPTVAELAEVVAHPGITRKAEFRFRHKDGHYLICEGLGRTILDDSASAGVVVNTRDITERKRAEEELRFQKTLLEAQSEATIDGILVVAVDGKITSLNRRLVEMWDIPEAVVPGRSNATALNAVLDKLVDPEEFLAEVAHLHENPDEESRGEIALRDGRFFDRYSAPIKSAEGTYYGRVWYFRDVTERKRSEAALREGEERLRFALETGGMGAWEWDIASGRMIWSPTLEAIHGRAPGSFRGTFADVLADTHPDDRERFANAIRSAVDGGGEDELEYRIVWPDGSVRWVEAKRRAIRGADGRPQRMVGVCRDITARREAEAALRQASAEAERAREEAEAANRAKSEFLSRMSHELRTPMNSILGFAQLLERKSPTPEQRRSVEYILKAGRHLLDLINEVLDIARIEADRLQLSLEPVRVGTILQEALTLIQPLAAQHDCRIEGREALHSDRYVLADRQRLTQVLLNLLSNAVKYNRPGGSVVLFCDEEDGRVAVRVRDSGQGIAPEKMDRLFVPFERLGAEQSGVEGTGLGLALSRRLVEAMNGALTAESTPGQGSTFSVALAPAQSPLERLEQSGRGGAAEECDADEGSTAKLLYIEDNLANLSLIETILGERAGITLLSALQGRLGLDLAWEHCPDVILLDLHLPDMSGDEVLARLQSQPRTQNIPVVVISADATPGRVERLMQSGARAYLTKPLDVDQFLTTIDEILEG